MSSLVEESRAACPGVAWTPVQPETLPALDDDGFPRGELRRLLADHGASPLILVNDRARVSHCGLPQLLHELRGVAPALRVLVATGTHAGDAAAESARLGCPALLHACDDAAAHVDVGGYGVDRRVLEASCVIAIGSVEPHYFAGWTGAHKTLGVGVWDRVTITANHEHACDVAAQPLDTGDGNPVAAGIRRGVRAFLEQGPPTLAVNHVLDPRGVPLAAGWGDPYAALDRVLPQARARCAHEQPQAVDVVVARVEGPLSRSLYQADKGVKNHEAVVKDGGLLVLVAELSDGLGPDRFVRRRAGAHGGGGASRDRPRRLHPRRPQGAALARPRGARGADRGREREPPPRRRARRRDPRRTERRGGVARRDAPGERDGPRRRRRRLRRQLTLLGAESHAGARLTPAPQPPARLHLSR